MSISIRSNRRGFTLIELVIIIVILGILSAVAIPKFLSIGKEAEISAVATMVSSLESTLAIYTANNLVKGEPIVVHNPFDNLSNTPTNYNGVSDPVTPANTPNGKWSFRTSGNWIMYNPNASISGGWSSGGERFIIYQVQLVMEDGNPVGMKLSNSGYPYTWN